MFVIGRYITQMFYVDRTKHGSPNEIIDQLFRTFTCPNHHKFNKISRRLGRETRVILRTRTHPSEIFFIRHRVSFRLHNTTVVIKLFLLLLYVSFAGKSRVSAAHALPSTSPRHRVNRSFVYRSYLGHSRRRP